MAEEESLAAFALESDEGQLQFLRLDAFGDRTNTEGVREFDGGPHDREVTVLGEHAVHEGSIYLQLVYRDLLDERQRRVPVSTENRVPFTVTGS